MAGVLYERDGRIGRITLNRPGVLNAIDADMPRELVAAVEEADADAGVHVMLLSGAGRAFCAGYDRADHDDGPSGGSTIDTGAFLSLFRAMKPVVCKVHGVAVAGGSDIALCADLTIMGEGAKIGYSPTRARGCPTMAMWVHRLGPEKAKRMMLTGDRITGREAADMGLVLKAVPDDLLDNEVEALAARMATVPVRQLAMNKMVVNRAVEATIAQVQRLATVFDGLPKGPIFEGRVEAVGWKQAVREREGGIGDQALSEG